MGIRMITVPPMGAVDDVVVDRRTGESWTVRVEPFDLAETVVTCEDWDQTLGLLGDPAFASHPKTGVSWREAITFYNRLSIREGWEPAYEVSQRSVAEPTQWRPHSEPRLDGWDVVWNHHAGGYRLPSDAEWQVAYRAGTTGARYGELGHIAWYADNSGGASHPVRLKQPNDWGLFDMLGGVWEWCWDLYDVDVYGSYRIIRGGGWSDAEWSCRSGVRRKTNPAASFDDLGFRLARGAVSVAPVRPS